MVKNPRAKAGDVASIPGLERYPGGACKHMRAKINYGQNSRQKQRGENNEVKISQSGLLKEAVFEPGLGREAEWNHAEV